jgi:uncharacterized membrane protein YeaQ/YmgE (transglycosylase-associated protein family)
MTFLGISYVNIMVWTLLGIMIGYTEHIHDRREVLGGAFATVIFGCIGALVTGYLVSFLQGKALFQFSIEGLVWAACGAFVLVGYFRISFHRKQYTKTKY